MLLPPDSSRVAKLTTAGKVRVVTPDGNYGKTMRLSRAEAEEDVNEVEDRLMAARWGTRASSPRSNASCWTGRFASHRGACHLLQLHRGTIRPGSIQHWDFTRPSATSRTYKRSCNQPNPELSTKPGATSE
jgi:hypothetical protein